MLLFVQKASMFGVEVDIDRDKKFPIKNCVVVIMSYGSILP